MIKKLQVPIFITIFLICLLTGFAVTPRLWSGLPESTPTPDNRANCFEEQCNFVIIHVNSLDSPEPILVSVWTAMVSTGSPPTMVLKPLYPSTAQTAESVMLGNTFRLTSKGLPAPEFLQVLTSLMFNQRGYIMMDNTAASVLVSWLANNSVSPETLVTDLDAGATLDQQRSLLNQVCEHMTTNPGTTIASPDWGNLVAAHLRTDLDFGTFVQNWERIALSGAMAHCEILP